MTLFNSSMDSFCRKYLVTGHEPLALEVVQFPSRYMMALAEIYEQLLLFDGVALKIYGENIPLAMLVNALGVSGVESLASDGALEFVLWTPVVTYNIDELPGIEPLQSGTLDSAPHCDPEKSIELGLGWLRDVPDRKTRRLLVRKLRDRYRIPSDALAHDVARMTLDSYKTGLLGSIGIPYGKPSMQLTKEERTKLCGCATDVLVAAVISQFGYVTFGEFKPYTLVSEAVTRTLRALKVRDDFCRILRLENVPDFRRFYAVRRPDFRAMLKVRKKPDAVRFRRWLYEVSENSNGSELTKAYLDAVADNAGFFDSRLGKLARTLSLCAVGAGVGSLVAGLPGSLVGLSVGKLADYAADLGLGLLDSYLLDGMLRGWTPRAFVSELRKLEETGTRR